MFENRFRLFLTIQGWYHSVHCISSQVAVEISRGLWIVSLLCSCYFSSVALNGLIEVKTCLQWSVMALGRKVLTKDTSCNVTVETCSGTVLVEPTKVKIVILSSQEVFQCWKSRSLHFVKLFHTANLKVPPELTILRPATRETCLTKPSTFFS